MIWKAIQRKLKIEQHEHHKKRGRNEVLQKGEQFLLH